MIEQEALQRISERLERIERLLSDNIAGKSVLNADEACALLHISKGHLYRLTSTQQIPHYKTARKLYFDRDELNQWLTSNKVATTNEIEKEATTYINIKKN